MQAPLSGDERELAAHHRLHNNLRNFQFWSACVLWFASTWFAVLLWFLDLPVNLPSRAEGVGFPTAGRKTGKIASE